MPKIDLNDDQFVYEMEFGDGRAAFVDVFVFATCLDEQQKLADGKALVNENLVDAFRKASASDPRSVIDGVPDERLFAAAARLSREIDRLGKG